MSMNSAALRKAWNAYEGDTSKMTKVPIGGQPLYFANESLEAWRALDTVLSAHKYAVRKKDSGSFNDRFIAGTKLKSLHAYGIAVDINWSTNMVKSNPKTPMRFSDGLTQDARAADVAAGRADTDMTREMVADILVIRTNDGKRVFEWGNWTTKIDPMHFELDVSPDDLQAGINPATVRDDVSGPDISPLPAPDEQKAPEANHAAMSPRFIEAHRWIAKWEGGFSNHEHDPGGATNFGITQAVLSQWRGKPVSVQDVKDLSPVEAREIFHARYWTPMRLDEIPSAAALMAYNCGVNSGPSRGIRFLQAAMTKQGISLDVDGRIGPQTIAAANGADQGRLVADYAAIYEAYYRGLSTWPYFGKGWMNRLRDVTAAAAALAGGFAAQAAATPIDGPSAVFADAQILPAVPTTTQQITPVKDSDMTAIDAVLGGSLLKGKKTLIAGLLAPLLYAAQNHGLLSLSPEAFNSIMGFVAAFGGLGLASKIERGTE